MKAKDIELGHRYLIKVSGKVVPVLVIGRSERITPSAPNGRDVWCCLNTETGKTIRVKSCQRFRGMAPVKGGVS